ncbi:hypothetical protein X777_05633 [Ooceraea biroi]|uniref:Uncharacterized protein n=1 Tax=Ooceraea biroi TaxID=2015173 RepID=A0A026WEM2_OOCBI|nr:hypothetical protein X777_05633 [Ooceraea biroi]
MANVAHEEERARHASCTTRLLEYGPNPAASTCKGERRRTPGWDTLYTHVDVYTRRVLDSCFRIRERGEKEQLPFLTFNSASSGDLYLFVTTARNMYPRLADNERRTRELASGPSSDLATSERIFNVRLKKTIVSYPRRTCADRLSLLPTLFSRPVAAPVLAVPRASIHPQRRVVLTVSRATNPRGAPTPAARPIAQAAGDRGVPRETLKGLFRRRLRDNTTRNS